MPEFHRGKGYRTFGVVAVDVQDRSVDHLSDVRAVHRGASTRSRGGITDAVEIQHHVLCTSSEADTHLLLFGIVSKGFKGQLYQDKIPLTRQLGAHFRHLCSEASCLGECQHSYRLRTEKSILIPSDSITTP